MIVLSSIMPFLICKSHLWLVLQSVVREMFGAIHLGLLWILDNTSCTSLFQAHLGPVILWLSPVLFLDLNLWKDNCRLPSLLLHTQLLTCRIIDESDLYQNYCGTPLRLFSSNSNSNLRWLDFLLGSVPNKQCSLISGEYDLLAGACLSHHNACMLILMTDIFHVLLYWYNKSIFFVLLKNTLWTNLMFKRG